ncbi:hypothetical protein BLNAU_22839 [Blattamonas nauphoetae]|uniref:Uncharacterized protein n=1 Tax=Blattamonas nauphoetae TaxID=2049346 RepID=A0ABQ9WRW3_9EUKA|nr:hypothetical protein BLNAU_22839 [Blattamonas nauphoetae]
MGEEKKDGRTRGMDGRTRGMDGRTRGMDGRTRGMDGRTQLDAMRDSEWGGEERDNEEEVFEKAKFRNLEIELNTFGTQTSPRSPFTHSPHPHFTHNQSTSTSSRSLNVSIPTQTSPRGPLSLSRSALQENTTIREAKSTKSIKQQLWSTTSEEVLVRSIPSLSPFSKCGVWKLRGMQIADEQYIVSTLSETRRVLMAYSCDGLLYFGDLIEDDVMQFGGVAWFTVNTNDDGTFEKTRAGGAARLPLLRRGTEA